MASIGETQQQGANCHKGEPILGVEAVAKVLKAHPNSVRRWANQGRLKCYLDVNGWRKFQIKDVLEFKSELERLI